MSPIPAQPQRVEVPVEVRCNVPGFNMLGRTWKQICCSEGPLVVSLAHVRWIDAQLSAVLGALITLAAKRRDHIDLEPPTEPVLSTLRRNKFLCDFGRPPLRDGYGTSVSYRNLPLANKEEFRGIVRSEFLGKAVFPDITDSVAKKIAESVSELFNNSCMHSESEEGVFLCGQYFLTASSLVFTFYDTGVGIPARVRGYLNQQLDDTRCIEWAMISGNSTTSGRSGGLGLGILEEFINLNGGELVVVSGKGYYAKGTGSAGEAAHLDYELPGTAVSIKVRTDDPSSYVLSEEIGADDIF